MKKILSSFLILVFLTSCVHPRENIETKEEYILSNYYPFLENTLLLYEGIGNEYAEQKVYFDFIKDNRAQIRVFNPGTLMGRVIKVGEEKIEVIFSKGEFYSLRDLTDIKENSKEIILQKPLEEGNTWTLEDGRERYISGVDVEVETPFDKFTSIEVTTESDDTKVFDYYVKGIGHVKRVFKSEDGHEIETNLESIIEDISTPYKIRFFYPDFHNEKLVYLDRKINFETNSNIEDIFEANFKDLPNENLNPIISPNTNINHIELNEELGVLEVDFSEELVSEMNAGHFLETMIIQSIVNTFGRHYRVDKVLITLDNQRYRSGHIELREGEFFEVDMGESVPY